MTTTMTTTLLKHEWLRTRGMLGSILGIVALVILLGAVLSMTGWALLATLGLGIAILAVLVLIPAVQLGLVVDYWRSGYGRTGYFTQTIPAQGSTIYWAKLLWAMIVSMGALVATLILGFLTWWAGSVQFGILSPTSGVIGEMWGAVTDVASPWMVAAGLLLLLAMFLVWPVYYYFAASVGSESRFAGLGVGGPIVVFVLLYIAMQIFSFLGLLLVPYGLDITDSELAIVPFNVLGEMSAGAGPSNAMPLGYLVPLALVAVYCLWRTVHSWNHKVALS